MDWPSDSGRHKASDPALCSSSGNGHASGGDEIMANWELARRNEQLLAIEPLA
jgi:hypothetical protein